jgi:hypothetical protein
MSEKHSVGAGLLEEFKLLLEQGYKNIRICTATHLNICSLYYSLLYSSQLYKLQVYVSRSYHEGQDSARGAM